MSIETQTAVERETETWYRADTWAGRITPVQVAEVTTHTLVIVKPSLYASGKTEGERVLREKNPELFPSEAEAVAYLFNRAESRLAAAQADMAKAAESLSRLRERYTVAVEVAA